MYKIIRFFSDDRPAKVIESGLTLELAQAWCNDPETSSSTAQNPERYGKGVEWFDGYNAEDK